VLLAVSDTVFSYKYIVSSHTQTIFLHYHNKNNNKDQDHHQDSYIQLFVFKDN
jgi:hypothetical protein